ncbi:MAG: GNAT family N-acetyltransferase [Anaerolineae bacterium]|nr:GNAT family N-acetyltransferase [Anaerolineae bacterium]
MYRLEGTDRRNAEPLLRDLAEVHLHVASVLDGASPGEIYVDRCDNPGAAYVAAGEGHYLAARKGMSSAFAAEVNARLPRDCVFALFHDRALSREDLEPVLAHTYAVPARRTYLRLRTPLLGDWRERVPVGFTLQPVDCAQIRGELAEAILEEWQSLDAFCARGFGFCVLHDGEIVSQCLVDYVVGQRCEIGVSTRRGFRRRGLATLVTAAAVEHALDAGFTEIGWHCWTNNVGSLGVARKVGFEPVLDYEVAINHWAAENVSDMPEHEFCSFAEGYERAFASDPPASGFPHIVAATAWSLCGENARCYRQIEAAVEVGWLRSVGQLQEIWPEFFAVQHLDRSPAWLAIAERLARGV